MRCCGWASWNPLVGGRSSITQSTLPPVPLPLPPAAAAFTELLDISSFRKLADVLAVAAAMPCAAPAARVLVPVELRRGMVIESLLPAAAPPPRELDASCLLVKRPQTSVAAGGSRSLASDRSVGSGARGSAVPGTANAASTAIAASAGMADLTLPEG